MNLFGTDKKLSSEFIKLHLTKQEKNLYLREHRKETGRSVILFPLKEVLN